MADGAGRSDGDGGVPSNYEQDNNAHEGAVRGQVLRRRRPRGTSVLATGPVPPSDAINLINPTPNTSADAQAVTDAANVGAAPRPVDVANVGGVAIAAAPRGPTDAQADERIVADPTNVGDGQAHGQAPAQLNVTIGGLAASVVGAHNAGVVPAGVVGAHNAVIVGAHNAVIVGAHNGDVPADVVGAHNADVPAGVVGAHNAVIVGAHNADVPAGVVGAHNVVIVGAHNAGFVPAGVVGAHNGGVVPAGVVGAHNGGVVPAGVVGVHNRGAVPAGVVGAHNGGAVPAGVVGAHNAAIGGAHHAGVVPAGQAPPQLNLGGAAAMPVAPPGPALAQPYFDIEAGLSGPPFRRSEVGPFF